MRYLLIAVIFSPQWRNTHCAAPPEPRQVIPPRTRPGRQFIVRDSDLTDQITTAASAVGADVEPLVYALDSLVRTAYGASVVEMLDVLTNAQIDEWETMLAELMRLIRSSEESCQDDHKPGVEGYVHQLIGVSDSSMDPHIILGPNFAGDGADRSAIFLNAIRAAESFSVECVIVAYANALNDIILRYLAMARHWAQIVSKSPRHVIMFGNIPDGSFDLELIRRVVNSENVLFVSEEMVVFAQTFPYWIESLGHVEDDELMKALHVPSEWLPEILESTRKDSSRVGKFSSGALIPLDAAFEERAGHVGYDLDLLKHEGEKRLGGDADLSEPNKKAFVALLRKVKNDLNQWTLTLATEVERRNREASARSSS